MLEQLRSCAVSQQCKASVNWQLHGLEILRHLHSKGKPGFPVSLRGHHGAREEGILSANPQERC
eukprot:1874251-Amphidinium_carterae.1